MDLPDIDLDAPVTGTLSVADICVLAGLADRLGDAQAEAGNLPEAQALWNLEAAMERQNDIAFRPDADHWHRRAAAHLARAFTETPGNDPDTGSIT